MTFIKNKKAATTIHYLFVLGFIGIVAISSLIIIGDSNDQNLGSSGQAIGDANTSLNDRLDGNGPTPVTADNIVDFADVAPVAPLNGEVLVRRSNTWTPAPLQPSVAVTQNITTSQALGTHDLCVLSGQSTLDGGTGSGCSISGSPESAWTITPNNNSGFLSSCEATCYNF